jgi:Uma2 family endonuclease
MNWSSQAVAGPIKYPDNDGLPMSDNTLQFQYIVTIKEGLEALFRDRLDVFVAGDLLWYPVEGRPDICTAPDALVAFGRPKGYRGSYMQWVEGGIAPQVVFEIWSPGNRQAGFIRKFDFYRDYGVEEYYFYDPDRGLLEGWQRAGDQLQEVPQMNGWVSPRLGVRFELVGNELRLFAPNGERFATYVELVEQREQARRQAAEAQQQAKQERLAREQAQQQAEQERLAREQAQQQAEQERLARERAEDWARRLAARLREMGIDPNSGAGNGSK